MFGRELIKEIHRIKVLVFINKRDVRFYLTFNVVLPDFTYKYRT